AIDAFADELELPRQEVMVFLAAREAAHLRLFAGAPWLRARVLATVDEYARGIRVDTSGLDDFASNLDPSMLQDPAKLQEMLSGGAEAIGPKVTNVNEAALGRLETLLALVEGCVDACVTDAAGAPVCRPISPAPRSAGSSSVRGGPARPPGCGAVWARPWAPSGATACGATPTSCPSARTSTIPPP